MMSPVAVCCLMGIGLIHEFDLHLSNYAAAAIAAAWSAARIGPRVCHRHEHVRLSGLDTIIPR